MLNRKSHQPVRVLIVDDQPAYAQTLELVLGTDERIKIVGHAVDGVDGVERALALRPDVVVMDVQMPRMDGIEATRQISELLPDTGVVVVTASTVIQGTKAIAAGATSFLHKDAPLDELGDSIVSAKRPRPKRGSTPFRVRMLEARAV